MVSVRMSHLKTITWVSREWRMSDRSDILSWTHHQILTPLKPEERLYWQELAGEGDENEKTGERKPWPVAKMKAKISSWGS